MKIFCKHNYILERVERFNNVVKSVETEGYIPEELYRLTKRGLIIVHKCSICHKVKIKKVVF